VRKRSALLWTLAVLLLALSLPATTIAATFTYTVKANVCKPSGGDFGYGRLYFEVRLDEYGKSGANKFTFDAKVQHRNIGSRTWRTEFKWNRFAYSFPNNKASYHYTRWFSYHPADYAWHRIVVNLKVWNGGLLLAKRKLIGKSC
jgi:hypothetical protein